MSQGILAFIAQRNAEAEAARVLGEALEKAREILHAAGVEEVEDLLQQILEADNG